MVRTIAELGGYAYSKSDDALYVNLYGGNTLTTTIGAAPLKMTQSTNYPWDGKVRITVDECPDQEFAIKLRIPGWCYGASIRVNGSPLLEKISPSRYFEIRRSWQAGDVVELDLPMPAQLIEAHPLVEETQHQVAVKRGPLVYCLESEDLPKNVQLEDVVIPAEAKFTTKYHADLLGGVEILETEALVEPATDWGSELYRPKQSVETKTIPLRLIPYYTWANRGAGEMTVWLPVK